MLIPFTSAYFSILQSWINSKELLFRFSGIDFSYPLSWHALEAYQDQHPDRKFYVDLFEDGIPYAFGEIIPQDQQSVRLARLLIGKSEYRGQGLGVQFIFRLLQEVKQTFKVNDVDLFVLADNAPAIRCYEKVGFKFVESADFMLPFEGQAYKIRKMHMLISS